MYQYKIKSSFDLVGSLSEEIYEKCRLHDIDTENCNKIDICVIEALNNVIKHSYNSLSENELSVLLDIDLEKVKLDISDNGIPRSNLGKARLDFDPEDISNLPEGGMGLFIIENLMDETYYISDGKTNVFTLIKYFRK
ncbi:MAG: ATP-binding protein [Ignavibacteria bacterium]|nr:ATP-binding protein [Ignavibacteria bacterium]